MLSVFNIDKILTMCENKHKFQFTVCKKIENTDILLKTIVRYESRRYPAF